MKSTAVLCAKCDRPVSDSLAVCTTCTDQFVEELLTVPGIIADIGITAARLDRMSNARNGGKSAEAPLPIRIDKRDELPHRRPFDSLVNSLTTWGRLFEEHYKLTIPLDAPGLRGLAMANRVGMRDDRRPPSEHKAPAEPIWIAVYATKDRKRVRLPDRISRVPRVSPEALDVIPITAAECVAVWLACNVTSIRLMPAAHEMLADLSNAIARARMAIDRLPELRYLGPCPTVVGQDDKGKARFCSYTLRSEKGKDWVRCGRCREQHKVTAIEEDARRRAENENRTIADIRQVLEAIGRPVPKSTLYYWAKERRIQPRGWQHRDSFGNVRVTDHWIHRDDQAVYRLGDVLELAEREVVSTVKGSTA